MGIYLNIRKLKVGIIGLGNIGFLYDLESNYGGPLSHAFAYKNNEKFNLYACADINNSILEKFSSVFPWVKLYSDYKKMLEEKNIEVLSICTPQDFHLEQIKEALKKNTIKIIFCEKPIVKNVKEYRELKTLMKKTNCVIMPNISRRFNSQLREIKNKIEDGVIGEIQKIHVRYTRGIYNTGAHLFDMISWWIGKITEVQALVQVSTTSENENEKSYSFNFFIGSNINGYAEAFDDRQYYFFEIDFYGSEGKLTFGNSGDEIFIYKIDRHSLFPEHKELKLISHTKGIMGESNFLLAMENILQIISNSSEQICTVEDAAYPLYVAEAIEKSYNTKKWEMVIYEK